MSARAILVVLLAAVWSGAAVAAELALMLSPEPMTPAPGRFAGSGGPVAAKPVSRSRKLRSLADDPAGCAPVGAESWVCNVSAAQRIAVLPSVFGRIGDEWPLRTGDGLARDDQDVREPAPDRR